MTKNPSVLKWLEDMKALVTPDQVVWIDGSEEQLEALRKEACSTGEMIKLNEEKLPAPHRRQRRCPRGGPYLYLCAQGRGCRPHQPLDGAPERL